MRIAYVVKNFDPSHGGAERDAYNSAVGLASLGQEVTVFTQSTTLRQSELPADLRIVKVPKVKGVASLSSGRFAKAIQCKIDDASDWDVLEAFSRVPIANTFRVCGGVHKSYLRQISPYRSSGSMLWDRVSPKSRMWTRLETEIFTKPDVSYIANSLRTKNEIVSEYGVSPDRISLVYPSVNLEQFNPEVTARSRSFSRSQWSVGEKEIVISFVGSSFFLKGLPFVFDTIAALGEEGISVRLLVAGRGAYSRFHRLAENIGIGRQVSFLGQVHDVSQVLAAADFFMLPSLYEPFGLAPLEAMACGVPTIITRQCGISELVTDQRDCLVLEAPGEVDRAVQFITRLIRNPEQRNEVSRRAAAVGKCYGASRYVKQLLCCYQEILEAKGSK